jgi:D-aminoacyl-tRNA deacylase
MRFVVLASKKDRAGRNIFSKLKVSKKLIEEESIYAEKIDKRLDADFIIFATKHKSKSGRKTLSCHAPGNWKEAKFGGKEKRVCKTSSIFLKRLFKNLNLEKKDLDYETTLEVTHHGPLIEKPCCFIEIGSSEKHWGEEEAGDVIARTIEKTINEYNKEGKSIPAIGIGGPHYCPSFNKIQLKSKYALSHIIPQYIFPINKEIILEAKNKTLEKVKLAIIDWKGLRGRERRETIKILNQLNLPHKKSSDIKL